MKAERHRRIVRILRERAVASQSELARLLRAQGERVTQATLSRDLEELGAFKARLPDGRVAYRVGEDLAGDAASRLRRMLVEFALEIDASGNIVVLKTPPGCAQPVARALDTAEVPGVLGTVAGDDTILVVCREGSPGRTIARDLRARAAPATGGNGRRGA